MTPDGVTFRHLKANGIWMRLAEAGPRHGPPVLLAHGWPESWYSWRLQFAPLAAAGYRVIAPDMRGFGGTEAPESVTDYDIGALVADQLGILDALDLLKPVIVGHDWGAVVAWHSVLMHPQRFRAVAAMSVPHFGRSDARPTTIWKQRFGEQFYYILYHQQPGRAESEYEADPRGLLRMLYASPDAPRAAPTITDPHRDAGGWIGRWGQPLELPPWLNAADLDYYEAEFRRAGFRGGLNYYRNIDRNWDLTESLDMRVKVPALFIAGSKDLTIAHLARDDIEGRLRRVVPDLQDFVWIEGAGHWIQQERPQDCNRALLQFLAGLAPDPSK